MIITPSLPQFLAEVTELYDQVFPHCLCPRPLYLEIIRINYLRHSASTTASQAGESVAELCYEANQLLSRIAAFSPKDWAQPGRYNAEWRLIGSIYQSAIAIYCISSLQSLSILPATPHLLASLASHGDNLISDLKTAVASKRLRRLMGWPLVVAGVEAVYRGEATRRWLEEALSELSRANGTSSFLKARAVLRRYWAREVAGWEECFCQPFALHF